MREKRSILKTCVWCACILAAAVLLTACAVKVKAGEDESDSEKTEAYAKYTEIKADDSGDVVISADGIGSEACYFNYDADGVTVQLVALRDAEDGVHIAFNTCQSCSPSPKAYYSQDGDVLRCMNCGFTFAPEEVGITQGGCNPWPIEGVEISDEKITIPSSSLDAMAPAFTSWGGPVE